MKELPQLNNITIQGIKKSKVKEIQEDTGLKMGVMLTDNLLITSENYIRKKFQEKGQHSARDKKKAARSKTSLHLNHTLLYENTHYNIFM